MRVLLAVSSRFVQQVLQRHLSFLAQAPVYCHGMAEALRLFQAGEFDLVCAEGLLPDGSGALAAGNSGAPEGATATGGVLGAAHFLSIKGITRIPTKVSTRTIARGMRSPPRPVVKEGLVYAATFSAKPRKLPFFR